MVSDAAATLGGMVDSSPGLRSGATPARRAHAPDEPRRGRRPAAPADARVAARGARRRPDGRVAARSSVILWGPPGTGKTTLAQAIARSSGRRFVELSAVTAGVRDVRAGHGGGAARSRDLYGLSTVLFLDEIHRFTKAQQDALLPGVENGWVILVAATTENPSFSVISPLLSRSLLLTLEPLTDDDLGMLVDRAVADPRGLGGGVALEPEARAAIIRLASGDARRALTALEAASVPRCAVADAGRRDGDGPTTTDDATSTDPQRPSPHHRRRRRQRRRPRAAALRPQRRRALRRHQRVHQVGARLRRRRRAALPRPHDRGGGGPAVHRPAHHRARRPRTSASPTRRRSAIAVAAADAVQFIGMPEGRIPLAEAVVLPRHRRRSRTPPTSASTAAIADVRAGGFGRVPKHLRDAHYPGAKRLGHGKGYVYPHDDAIGVVRAAVPARRAARRALLRADRARQRARGVGPAREAPPHRAGGG